MNVYVKPYFLLSASECLERDESLFWRIHVNMGFCLESARHAFSQVWALRETA